VLCSLTSVEQVPSATRVMLRVQAL
jgi:hypothetical protein